MTIASPQVHNTSGATLMSGARRFRQSITHLRLLLDRQRQRRALLDLDDHMLNDIGKSRQEARNEAHKPFWK